MELSRNVPAHRHVEKFVWCKKDFLVMGEDYRKARARMSTPMDTCYWCKHKFEDGEMMALACPEKGRNKILCQTCASELRDHGQDER